MEDKHIFLFKQAECNFALLNTNREVITKGTECPTNMGD